MAKRSKKAVASKWRNRKTRTSTTPGSDAKSVVAISRQGTNHLHLFDAAGSQSYAAGSQLQRAAQWQLDHDLCAALLAGLAGLADPIVTLPLFVARPTKLYRIVDGVFDPLATEGTLMAGGRLNVGGAQVLPEFAGKLEARSGLYASFSDEAAWAEYTAAGLPGRAWTIYGITRVDEAAMTLIDFDAVLAVLEPAVKISPKSLVALCQDVPTAGAWKYQKAPKVSQALGHWIRQRANAVAANVDGLAYRSVQDPQGFNAFLFFDDAAAARATLQAAAVRRMTGPVEG